MFTIPAIHHSSVKVTAASVGTMHLNALNGSSNVLCYTDSDSKSYSCQSGVFGGIIGVSLSENHPYRPQDCGMTFHETSKFSHKKSTSSSSEFSNSSSHNRSSSNDDNSNLKYTDAMASLRGSETASPIGPRRRSFDLDVVSTKPHRRYEDRSLSLDELVIGPLSSFGRALGDAIDEYEQASDPDLAGLSLTEVSISASRSQGSSHITNTSSKSNHAKRKKRSHTADSTVSERALRLLEKIKGSKKDNNSNIKNSQHKSEDNSKDCDHHQQSAKVDITKTRTA